MHIIKLYKVHELVHGFTWLTWFTGLVSLTFFFFISYVDTGLIENLVL
jgi:hypothetical protein